MFRVKKFLVSFLKWTVTILALGNLVFLFVFDYQLPGFLTAAVSSTSTVSPENESPKSQDAETETVARTSETAAADTTDTSSPETDTDLSETEMLTAQAATESSLAFQIPSEALTYDASGELDLLSGVAVTDASGNVQPDIEIFSTIKPGSSSREKIIEYSATGADGERITAERTLNLGANYIGPVIELLGSVPAVKEEELSSLLSILLGSQLMKADDGFGQDVSASVTASVKSDPEPDTDEAVVTLTVTNLVNDSYSLDVNVPLLTDGPMLRLTTDQVNLKVGDFFSFYDYIASATDADGNSLHHMIQMSGSVDTSTAGTYVLEFFCTDAAGNQSPVKTLTVIVE